MSHSRSASANAQAPFTDTSSSEQDDEYVFDEVDEPNVWDDVREQVGAAAAVTRAWIVANPIKALGVAAGAGFVIGRILRR